MKIVNIARVIREARTAEQMRKTSELLDRLSRTHEQKRKEEIEGLLDVVERRWIEQQRKAKP